MERVSCVFMGGIVAEGRSGCHRLKAPVSVMDIFSSLPCWVCFDENTDHILGLEKPFAGIRHLRLVDTFGGTLNEIFD